MDNSVAEPVTKNGCILKMYCGQTSDYNKKTTTYECLDNPTPEPGPGPNPEPVVPDTKVASEEFIKCDPDAMAPTSA